MRLTSPVAGTVRALSSVPDRVFAEGLVGPGAAVEPVRTAVQHVLAPADGVVTALHPHAFAIRVSDERSVLVHLGVDTVTLAGAGFSAHVVAGQRVRAGERVVTWSPVDVAASGLASVLSAGAPGSASAGGAATPAASSPGFIATSPGSTQSAFPTTTTWPSAVEPSDGNGARTPSAREERTCWGSCSACSSEFRF